MCKRAFYFILIGWFFVCVDIGPIIDKLDDGVGYLLIGIGMCFTEEKGKLHVPIALSFALAPICTFVSILRAFGSPSWGITFLRCVPPLLSLPIGIALSNLENIKKQKKKRTDGSSFLYLRKERVRTYIYYTIAQVMDVFCILYFLPSRTSVIINNFNTESPFRFIPLFLYIATMLLYLFNIYNSNYK